MDRAAGDPADLYSLLYCSRATALMTPEELPHIMGSAWRHNRPMAVTGLLVLGGGLFLQWLEGPRANVRELMGRLLKDPRHDCLTELHAYAHAPGTTRLYPSWSMQYVSPMEILGVLEQERRKSPHQSHAHAINLLMDLLQAGSGPLAGLRQA